MADSYIVSTSETPRTAAEKAEKDKIALYEELTDDYIFTPNAASILVTVSSGWNLEEKFYL